MRHPLLCLGAGVFFSAFFTVTSCAESLLPPPPGKLYHGNYPGGESGEEDDITPEGLAAYEDACGKKAAWVYFSHNWYANREFPRATAEWIRERGAVPYIRLMLRSKGHRPGRAERVFSLRAILAGKFDEDFRRWAREARDFGSPLLVEYGTEMNGRWFGWNGKYHGAGRKRNYGDRKKPDGPERFVDAWRRIVRLMREEGAENITWVWHINADDDPDKEWNRFERYYPGDDVVDWIGVSVYGLQEPLEKWNPPPFAEVMDGVCARLDALAPSKPIIVAEFGHTINNPRKKAEDWADEALAGLLDGRWPGVIGFSWWNENWQNDNKPAHNTIMRIQDHAPLEKVFRDRFDAAAEVLQAEPVVVSEP